MRFLSTGRVITEIEAADTPMWIFDQETLAFLAVNDAAVELYGYSRKEFLSMTILDIRPPEDVAPLVRETLDPGLKGPSVKEHWRHCTKAGLIFPVEISSWEITFQGRPAELVSATPIVSESTEQHFDLPAQDWSSAEHHN